MLHFFLRQVIPPNSGDPIEIHITKDEVQVGRKKIQTLAKFPQISREHAVFYRSENDALFVRDLNSLNGVFVNDVRIGSSLKLLSTGDIIGLGVTSAAASEGFVCVLCAETRAKPEVIDLSDDEPEVIIDSERKLSSESSGLQTSLLNKTDALRSKTDIENTRFNENKTAPESHAAGNASESQNAVQSLERKMQPHEKIIPVKKCVVPVVRCDSGDFQIPSGVKSPFRCDDKRKKDPSKRPKKRIRVLSSDTSEEDSNGTVLPITPSKENPQTDSEFSTKYKSDCQTNPAERNEKLSAVSGNDNTSTPLKENPVEDVSYSQGEDIIYISDDEIYLDFNSSQDYVQIKKEPEEVDEDDDIYKEIFESESVHERECMHYNSKEHESVRQDSDDRVESIESIRAFVSGLERKDSNGLSAGTNYVQVNNSRFPVSSQDSDSSEDTDTASGDDVMLSPAARNSAEEYQATDTNPPGSKNLKKSGGKILLIDPKPMTYRPRRLRGRDEGFVEKSRSTTLDRLTSVARQRKESRQKKHLENVIPDSGTEKLKTPRNQVDRTDKARRHENDNSPPQIASTSRQAEPSPKPSCIKTRPEKFSSRMGFLTSETPVNPQRGNKSKTDNKTVHLDKKNILQNSVVKNRNVYDFDKSAPDTPVPSPPSLNKFVNPSNAGANSANCSTQNRKRSGEPPCGYCSKGNKQVQAFTNSDTGIKSYSSSHVSDKTSPPAAGNSLVSKISFDGVMKKLLQMNTKWLKEQITLKVPPSPVSKGAADLPLSYRSYDSYVTSFYPMIMLEIWEYMFTESKEVYTSNKQYKKFYFSILSYTSREDCIELKCESVVNEKVCFGPREGVITVLELKENSRKCSPVFGYIFKHKIVPLNLNSLRISQWKNLPEIYLQNAKHWTFQAYVKKKDMSFELDSLMKGNGLCYIRSKLRLADALRFIKDSPLLRDILTPREATATADRFMSSPSREYTSSQTEIIRRISVEISEHHMQPKIVLLHGPPGTGKTHSVIGLLEKLFYSGKRKSNLKILITAPSNEAIDEIGCRLIELNERSGWRDNSIKFIRVGLEKQIHAKMMPFFVDKKAKELYQQSSYHQAKLRETELQNLLSEINKLEMDPPAKRRHDRLKYLRNKFKHVSEKNSVKTMDYYTEMTYKSSILKESDIILSTLSSCGLSLLHRTFTLSSNEFFSCCIIDDATQCTELEALQPLAFGVSKLILVGDHEQLPVSVLSKLASQYGFERSMFERFHLCFQRLNQNPVLTLTEQFRMHAAICEFPSKHFYAHKLLTHPDTILRYKSFPLNPYVVLDLFTDPDSMDLPSKAEASVMLYICKFVVDSTDSQSSIGIIVPHQTKRSFYIKTFHAHPCLKQIEINTVDGFQGREKDVIILSALNADNHRDGVRFLSSRQQLNVALTRARKCLVVCVSSTELMVHPDWRALVHDARERKVFKCANLHATSPRHISYILENCLKKRKGSR